jgi:hypothetical protein
MSETTADGGRATEEEAQSVSGHQSSVDSVFDVPWYRNLDWDFLLLFPGCIVIEVVFYWIMKYSSLPSWLANF